MSAEAMLKAWRELVEPAVTTQTNESTTTQQVSTCMEWRACCCQNAADGHCWACGKKQGEHPGFGGDEETTWPGVDRLPTVEKGESDADEQC